MEIGGNYLAQYLVKVEVRPILPLLIYEVMLQKKRNERSFETVSKDKPALRRRAAFDTDEKDVRRERCKDTIR